MDDSRSPRLATWAISLFVFFSSFGLWVAIYSNNGSPYDRTSRGPFLLLLIALGFLAYGRRLRPIPAAWSLVSLLMALLRWLADVNALGHIAILLLTAGLVKGTLKMAVWCIAFLTMLPAFSQILKEQFDTEDALLIRCTAAVVCTIAIILPSKKGDHHAAS